MPELRNLNNFLQRDEQRGERARIRLEEELGRPLNDQEQAWLGLWITTVRGNQKVTMSLLKDGIRRDMVGVVFYCNGTFGIGLTQADKGEMDFLPSKYPSDVAAKIMLLHDIIASGATVIQLRGATDLISDVFESASGEAETLLRIRQNRARKRGETIPPNVCPQAGRALDVDD